MNNLLETLMRLWQGTLGPQAPEVLNPYQAQDRELEARMLAANQSPVVPIPPAGMVPYTGELRIEPDSTLFTHKPRNLPAGPGAGTPWTVSERDVTEMQNFLQPSFRQPGPLSQEQLMMLLSQSFRR